MGVAHADGERPTFAANTDIQGPTKGVVLSFHPKDDGTKLLDGWRKTYARYKIRDGRVEVYADGRPLVGLLSAAGLSIDLRDADGKRRYLAERGLGPEAAACFLFDAVPLVWRGAFAFQLQRETANR